MISDTELDALRLSGEKVRVVRDELESNDVKGIVVAWDGEQVLIRRQNRLEDQPHRRQHPDYLLGSPFVEVEDMHRSPRRHDDGLVDGGQELGQPSVEQPESQASAQGYGPVALLEPADGGPCIRREVRSTGGLGAQTQLLEGAFDSVRNLGQAPVLVADVEERSSRLEEQFDRVVRLDEMSGVVTGEHQ